VCPIGSSSCVSHVTRYVVQEWDEPSLSLVLSEQRPMHDTEAEESRKHVLPVDLGFIGHSSFSNEESIEERILLKRNDKLEKENADTFSLRQFALGRCPSWLCEIKLEVVRIRTHLCVFNMFKLSLGFIRAIICCSVR